MQTNIHQRNQLQDLLRSRFPDAIPTPLRAKVSKITCGIAALDEMLQGGLPVGALVELVGTQCSGRTTAALAYMAALTQAGCVVAWIDVSDAADPESIAACGVDLERLLWVRCGVKKQSALLSSPEPGQGLPIAIPSEILGSRHTGGGSPHPRSEDRDMPYAVRDLLQAHSRMHDNEVRRKKRSIGTPGAPNRPIANRSKNREEQVNSDRLPPRRGDNLTLEPRTTALPPRGGPNEQPIEQQLADVSCVFRAGTSAQKPWPLLDQGLRVADLLLQGGGFSAIVLDLSSTLPEAAWRIPMATWFRFRAACERTRTSLVLLTQHPCARSSAEIVVRLQTGIMQVDKSVLTGIHYQGTAERTRAYSSHTNVVSIRKPPKADRPGVWTADAIWAQAL